jgi:2-dehydro-3-deoxyphosphogluconate aldolase / (4S)-4-hydroxy-2-oxoglutarate aldolase
MQSSGDRPTHPVVRTMLTQRLIAVIRTSSPALAIAAGRALFAAGLSAVEVALTTPGALDAIGMLTGERPEGSWVGAGTVLDVAMASDAEAAGAAFLVAPNLNPAVVSRGHVGGLAVIPGVLTPSEMVQAYQAGADLIKVFPATAWTPTALKDVRAALPHLPLVPTGGVRIDRAADWINAGAVAVGVGRELTMGDSQEISRRARHLLATLKAAGS